MISVATQTTAAGKTDFIGIVKSIKGIGKMETVSVKNTEDKVGTTTYKTPQTAQIKAPVLNTCQRHPSCLEDVSASAVAPQACTAAMGKGNFSTSCVTRNST